MAPQEPPEKPHLWEYVTVNRYALPSPAAELPDRHDFTGFWRWFRPKPDDRATRDSDGEPASLPEELLRRLTPRTDQREAAAALEAALAPRLDGEPPETKPAVVIGAPHSGTAEILVEWAALRGWRVIEPPEVERILAQDEDWVTEIGGQSSPWVLARLERCYLRHPRGIHLIRRLLETQAPGAVPCVIGCDSWAWAYLAHVAPGTARMPKPLVAQAFDQDRLGRLLQTGSAIGEPRVLVREADSGKIVLPAAPAPEESEGQSAEPSSFLRHLAAYSLGVPSVARAVWLRALAGATLAPPREEAPPASPARREVRMAAWKQLGRLTLPANARDHAIVLHTLLLHNGLAAETLPRLLPLSPTEIAQDLDRLCASDLLEESGDGWRVTAAAYPAVRKFLGDEGYLIDAIPE